MTMAMILAIFGPMIVPKPPTLSYVGQHLLPPCQEFWFGTDVNGMDIFSRCIAAFRVDLLIALSGALLSAIIGGSVGIFAGYFDGRGGFKGFVSMVILRLEDVIQAFPFFVLALVLVTALGPKPINIIIAIVALNHIPNLRLARSEVLSLRDKPFVEAARAAGNSELKIAYGHVMPNAINPVVALVSLVMGFAILLTAGLSFVGAGVEVPTPEWGSMISVGAPSMITGQWWPCVFPGAFMAITVFALSMCGEALTSLYDPLERVKLGYR